jgi:hypothetical protein
VREQSAVAQTLTDEPEITVTTAGMIAT